MNEDQSNAELQDLYRELILDHARKPRNFGRLNESTHTAEGINPLCGDKLRLYLNVDSGQMITDVGFEGSGCAICMASASLLTETVNKLSVTDADSCFASVTSRLTQQNDNIPAPENVDLSKLRALDGVSQHPSRIKCATLAWHALHAALTQTTSIATTE
jgi:nitrogen fixation NifU-like protein